MHWYQALHQWLEQGEPCVLVTITQEQGSTPRNAGSKMVVSASNSCGSIGGGHLEFRSIAIARELLEHGQQSIHTERFSLGASLGQCCGGVTQVLFEPVGVPRAHLAVFGAGHVARALVPILAALPCQVHWIDQRPQEFPSEIPSGVKTHITDDEIEIVEGLPAGCFYIVLTHDHQLDLEITHAILRRNDFGYFGLIGSRTKRKKFEHRLLQRGITKETLERMQCPMGLPEVQGKLPMEVAVAIAGEVIAQYQSNPSSSHAEHAPSHILT